MAVALVLYCHDLCLQAEEETVGVLSSDRDTTEKIIVPDITSVRAG